MTENSDASSRNSKSEWKNKLRRRRNVVENVKVSRERLPVRLSVVCLSVTFVHATQAIEIFDNVLRHLVRWPRAVFVKFSLGVRVSTGYDQWHWKHFKSGAQIPARSAGKIFLLCLPRLFRGASHDRAKCRHSIIRTELGQSWRTVRGQSDL